VPRDLARLGRADRNLEGVPKRILHADVEKATGEALEALA
jgi:hypothetical protein